AAILVLVLIGAGTLGWALRSPTPAREGPQLRIVQPNIGQQDKWSPGFEARGLAQLGTLSRAAPDGDAPRLLIWPEAAVTEPLQDERLLSPAAQGQLAMTRAVVARMMTPRDLLLTGGI